MNVKKTMNIEGMSCEHCVRRTAKALEEIPGVTDVKVNLEQKNAVLKASTEIADELIKNAVVEAGYTVSAIH